MDNDCGCTKKIVDKIYIENSCCGKKEKKTDCNNSCCTSCGKQIDLIDSDLYAENIYNYQQNTTFNANQIILKEGELREPNTVQLKEQVYEILSTTDNITEVLIQLQQRNGFYGLNCLASIRKEDEKYTVAYVKQYKDDSMNIQNKTKKIRTIFCVYTNDYQNATYQEFDITYYTYDEIISILSEYVKTDDMQQYILNLLQNYYTKTEIDIKIGEVEAKEDCLFQEHTITMPEDYAGDSELENYYQEFEDNNLNFSTTRKNDSSEASGLQSFSMQAGKAKGDYSVAFSKGESRSDYSITAQKSVATGTNSIALQESTSNGVNSVSIQNSQALKKNSIAAQGGVVTEEKSVALQGKVTSKDSISLLDSTSYSGKITEGSSDGSFYNSDYSNEQNEKCAKSRKSQYINHNIAINGGKATGQSCIAIGSFKDDYFGYANATYNGSVAIGQDVYSGGEFSYAFGQGSEIGRYRKRVGNDITFEYGGNLDSQGSTLHGNYISIYGPFNSAFGDRHFLLGQGSFATGSGQTTDGNNNLLFGHRNRAMACDNNISGGQYSSILNSLGKTQGAVSIGDAAKIENLYLQFQRSYNDTETNKIVYEYLLEYKNNSNVLEPLVEGQILSYMLLESNIELRNGTKGYLATFEFPDYKNNNPIYPTPYNIIIDHSTVHILFDFNIETYVNTNSEYSSGNNKIFECKVKLLNTGNTSNSSGSISLGIGNTANGMGSTAIGYCNIANGQGAFSCGKFSLSSNDLLFSIGNGNYNEQNQTITRSNIFEATDDDIYFNVEISNQGIRKYSMKSIIQQLINSGVSVDSISTQTTANTQNLLDTRSTSIPMYALPGYTDLGNNNWYVKLKDNTGSNTMSVLDPLGVVPTSNPDGKLD